MKNDEKWDGMLNHLSVFGWAMLFCSVSFYNEQGGLLYSAGTSLELCWPKLTLSKIRERICKNNSNNNSNSNNRGFVTTTTKTAAAATTTRTTTATTTTKKANGPRRSKLGHRWNSWQWAKHAWLYSDRIQALVGDYCLSAVGETWIYASAVPIWSGRGRGGVCVFVCVGEGGGVGGKLPNLE